LRKAALRGGAMLIINPVDFDFNWTAQEKIICAPGAMVANLAGVARALADAANDTDALARLRDVQVNDAHRRIAERLKKAETSSIIFGNIAASHPDGSILRTLGQIIGRLSGSTLGFLSDGANSAGAHLAGALPHRAPNGQQVSEPGMDAMAALRKRIRAYLLFGIDPELDCLDGHAAKIAMERAGLVVAITAFRSEFLDNSAHVLLPMTSFAETSGTYVNVEGVWQGFDAVVNPPGESRPGWKILRVLGNELGLQGFDYVQSTDVRDALKAMLSEQVPENYAAPPSGALVYRPPASGLEKLTIVPMYSADPVVRRASALQATGLIADDKIRVSPGFAASHGLTDGARVRLIHGEVRTVGVLQIDTKVPDSCVLVYGAGPMFDSGAAYGAVQVERA
jgi:NADH-quinone oxidoreductase subunit G